MMENLTLDLLFFSMCLLFPFVMMVSIAIHFVWRFLSHKSDDCGDYDSKDL